MHAEAFLTTPSSCDASADGPDHMPLADGVPSAYRVGPRGYSWPAVQSRMNTGSSIQGCN